MQVPIFAHVAAATFLLPAGSGIYYWKFLTLPRKIFAVFCFYAVLHLVVEFILGRMGISNQFLINFFWLIEFECILYIYYSWTSVQSYKKIIPIVGAVFLLFWLYEKLSSEDPKQFSESISTVSHFVLIIFSLIILQSVFRRTKESITKQTLFWIACGTLLYNTGTIIAFSMSNTVMRMGIDYFIAMWYVNWACTIVANIFYMRSFACKMF